MKRTVRTISIAAVATVLATAPAAAANCTISPQSVSFGNYDTLDSQPLDGVGNISVQCDAMTSFTISLDSGSGTYSGRQMTSGTNVLEYNLYTDASHVSIWGDGSSGTTVVSDSASSAEEPVYGRIAARQDVPAGTYTDVIVVTVTY